MKTKFLIIYLCVVSFSVSAQKYDYIWHTGYSFYPTWGFQINFNDNKFKMDTFRRAYSFLHTCASMSDSTGKLLFSTNGCRIFNQKYKVMQNGDSLNLETGYNSSCFNTSSEIFIGGGEVIPQAALALPVPQSKDSLFAIFRTQSKDIGKNEVQFNAYNLYYCLINMNKNNGLGRVEIKNQVIVSDTLDGGNVNAVKHRNGRDWWIITRKYLSNSFFTFKLSPKGVDTFFIQSIGDSTKLYGQDSGQSSFSPNGKLYAYHNKYDDLMLYDFDRNTGKLKNYRRKIIPLRSRNGLIVSGSSFSPNSQFLYLFVTHEIFQVNLEETDSLKFVEKIADFDNVAAPYAFPTNAQLAPDCKIYFTSNNGLKYFGYVRYPDKKGVACQVVQGGVKTPYNCAIVAGMPNNPNYRLGVTPTYPCDSTIEFKVATSEVQLPPAQYILYPNPTNTTLNIDYEPTSGETKADVTITDLLGKIVLFQKLDLYTTPLSMDIQNLPSGMYHCIFKVKDKLPTAQRFVIIR